MKYLEIVGFFSELCAPQHPLGNVVNAVIAQQYRSTVIFEKPESAIRNMFNNFRPHMAEGDILKLLAAAVYLHINNKTLLDSLDAVNKALQKSFVKCFANVAQWCLNLEVELTNPNSPAIPLNLANSYDIKPLNLASDCKTMLFNYPALNECVCKKVWDRNLEKNIRTLAENELIEYAKSLGQDKFTIISIGSGLLKQEAYIAYKLSLHGIAAHFILIDPLYLKGFTDESEFSDQLRQAFSHFNKFLKNLPHVRSKVLGVFSCMDSYLAAYQRLPAPQYQVTDLKPRNRYTLRFEHEFQIGHKDKNFILSNEVRCYTDTCYGVKPDYVLCMDVYFINNSNIDIEETDANFIAMFDLEHGSKLLKVLGKELMPPIRTYEGGGLNEDEVIISQYISAEQNKDGQAWLNYKSNKFKLS